MGATLLLHALLGASGASRLSHSRITSYFQPFEQGPLSADALQRLRGGATAGTCDVVLVGCGVPKRGMGWYHAKQMIEGDVPSAKLTTVCEPWFLGAGADSPPGKEFNAWADEMKSNHGIKFCASVADMEINGPTLALISGRTADNPKLLKEVIEAGCTHVYLEKPGAPTVAELEEMKAYAAEKGVPVYMGYNKNVTPYVLKALEVEKATPGATTTFVHLNAYKEEELPECFERNAEGMLKNMAVHELALLATYYGVTVDNIASVTPDAEYSRCMTLTGPGGSEFTDFAKLGFTVQTKDGKTVTVKADRCGSTTGGGSEAIVSVDGEVKFTSVTPDDELQKFCDEQAAADPEMMPYFFLQSEDYVTLKERSTAHILSGAAGAPEGMATIDTAVETLKVAEYLQPLLQEALLK
jgi:predicted dehydrogenase